MSLGYMRCEVGRWIGKERREGRESALKILHKP